MDLRHMPGGTHSLAPRPGPLARLTFRKKWSGGVMEYWSDGERIAASLNAPLRQYSSTPFRIGPRGRICTCNLPGLSGTPLLVGLHAGKRIGFMDGWIGGLMGNTGRRFRPMSHYSTTPSLHTAIGAPGRSCTDTGRGLSPLPLPWATGAGSEDPTPRP